MIRRLRRKLANEIERLSVAVETLGPAACARRLLRYVLQPSIAVDAHTIRTRTVFGHELYLDARDTSLLPNLVNRGYWEPWVTRALLRHVRPGDRIVEVGACVGYFSLLFASRVGPGGSVTSFEANPRMIDLLRRTLAANRVGSAVRLVPLAVVDRPSCVTLHRLRRQQGSSSLYAFTTTELAAWDDVAAPLEIEATSLDAFFGAEEPPLDLIKIDAEGAEPAIVAGMQRLLSRAPRVRLVVEFVPAHLARGGQDPRGFLAGLVDLGFRLHRIDRRGRVQPETIEGLLASTAEELYLTR